MRLKACNCQTSEIQSKFEAETEANEAGPHAATLLCEPESTEVYTIHSPDLAQWQHPSVCTGKLTSGYWVANDETANSKDEWNRADNEEGVRKAGVLQAPHPAAEVCAQRCPSTSNEGALASNLAKVICITSYMLLLA